MSMIAFFMIFPALFMTHEMEELIFMPGFVTKLPASKATKKVQAYYSHWFLILRFWSNSCFCY